MEKRKYIFIDEREGDKYFMVGSGKENFSSPERMLGITCSLGEKI